MWRPAAVLVLAVIALLCPAPAARGQDAIRVATYNVENYLLRPAGSRPAKSAAARARVCAILLEVKADVLALQEMGGLSDLEALRQDLKAGGLEYPHWEHITAFDTNIHLALLSRLPITARRPHTNDTFLLRGRRFQVGRGFLEADLRAGRYAFTVLACHLKSRRPVPDADEAEMREEEARLLRGLVEARLKGSPRTNLVVLGDCNDLKDSTTLGLLLGRGATKLWDTRPAERNNDQAAAANPSYDPRRITWTHYYGKQDTYSRVDYVLLSPGMKPEWRPEESYVWSGPDWGEASDHRPVVVVFTARDK